MPDKPETTSDLIQKSFLSATEKQSLEDQLLKDGESQTFWSTFNTLLSRRTEAIGQKYEQIIKEFDAQTTSLEKNLEEEKNIALKKAEEQLSSLASDDLIKRAGIWEEYWQTIEKLDEQYEVELKKKVSTLVLSASQSV